MEQKTKAFTNQVDFDEWLRLYYPHNFDCIEITISYSILTPSDKKYLKRALKPFAEFDIRRLEKRPCTICDKEFERIELSIFYDGGLGKQFITLTPFPKGHRFCGMEQFKQYTPEELGLTL